MRERKLVERAVRISGMFVLLSGMGLQPCLASHSYNAAPAGVVQVEQQKQKITGCVLDVTGSPLPGASVLVKGAPGRGAITDMMVTSRLKRNRESNLKSPLLEWKHKS